MTKIPSLKRGPPPEFQRAFQLVGEFMWQWALLEGELNRSLHALLSVRGLEAVILTANMGVRDKIHTVKTLVNLYSRLDPAWLEQANTDIEAIASMSEQRNVAAHTFFAPHAKGGVEFMTIKAKGKLAAPKVVWGVKTFERYHDEMQRLTSALSHIVKDVEFNRDLSKTALVKALAASRGTTQGSVAPGSPGLLMTQPLRPRSSQPAKRETKPQTNEAPPRKPKGSRKKG